MNKKNIKPLIMSSLAALSMCSISVAGTFALFTDKAETTINIGSGKVDISQELSITSVSELGGVNVAASDGIYTNSIGGTTKINANGELVLDKWAPGDKAVILITNKNSSNVTIKTRFVVSHTSTSDPDLWEALTVTYDAVDENENDISHKFMDWSIVEPTVTTISKVRVTIEFKDHDNGNIRFGEDNLDNDFQNCNCSILFTQEAVQGNAQANSLVDQLNAVLDASPAKNDTLHDALVELQAANDQDWGENLIKNNIFLWNSESDHFVYRDEAAAGQEYKYFRIYDLMPSQQLYSVYASKLWDDAQVSLTGIGFDAGDATGITSVTYIGTASARENLIRTNSASTSLVVNAPLDTVHHYGSAGSVDIIAAANQSYHENGSVAFMEVAKGRVVLESDSDVAQIHISTKVTEVDATTGEKTKVADVFDDIKIAYAEEVTTLPAFSRDAVEIADNGTLVVELQKLDEEKKVESNEFVWLTKQGVYQQIAISDNSTSVVSTATEATVYADEVSNQKTQTAAQQIANNIADQVEINSVTYNVSVNSSRDIVLTNADVPTDSQQASAAVIETYEVVKESGLTETAKDEAKTEKVEKAIDDEVVEKSTDEVEYVARIGAEGYETLKEALDYVCEGETVHLLKDITVDQYIKGQDYYKRQCYVKWLSEGCVLDGGNHTVTMAGQTSETLFISDLYGGTIKNITIAGLNGPICGDVEMGAVFQGVTAKGAFDVDGNCAAFCTYVWENDWTDTNKLTFIDCVNEVNLTGTGTKSDYNAAFIGWSGYPNKSAYDIRFTRCVNKGNIVGGSSGMFIANPGNYVGTITINNCRNEGLIQRTYIPEDQYRVNQLIYGTVSDWGVTTVIDGVSYTMAQVRSREAELAIAGNPLVLGSADSQLSLAKNSDGTFAFHGTPGAAYYVMNVGLYVGLPNGSTRNFVSQTIDAVENKENYVTDLKDLCFVDQQWLVAHVDAVISHPAWNESISIVTYENNQYYLLNSESYSVKGQVTESTLISISAFDANDGLIASTGL